MNGRSSSGLSVAVCGAGVLLVAVGLWAAFAVVEPREAEGGLGVPGELSL